MTETELIETVFSRYYYNSFLPTEVGGFPYSNLFQILASFETYYDVKKNNVDISDVWIDGKSVTWYTRFLSNLITLPRFPEDSDQDYLNRLDAINSARAYGGQSEKSIKIVLMSLLSFTLNGDDRNIDFITNADFYQWDDATAPTVASPANYSTNGTWADKNTSPSETFVVKITFPNSGSDVDPLNYEYWIKSKNYTKIEDLVKLFKPVGSNFKLELTL